MNCPKCGYSMSDLEIACTRCEIASNSPKVDARVKSQIKQKHGNGHIETGEDLLVFVFSLLLPVGGIAIYAMNHDINPHRAKVAATGVAMGIALGVMLSAIFHDYSNVFNE